jgi:DNA/RNA endonuclease YhcR with UshA esterase domain
LRRLKTLTIVAFCLFASAILFSQTKRISPAEAKDHVGERATVCGGVVSTRFATRSKGEPTFLNLDQPYPKQIFTIVIWGSDRSKFGDPTAKYTAKRVCVTGRIALYRGVPEIAVSDPNQIEIQK